MMKRGELASLVAARLGPQHVVICGLGSTTYAWQAANPGVPTYYAADPMGLAPALALGFALASPGNEVVLLEGDGDMIMNLGVLLTVVDAAPANLRVIVFHNGRYETGGSQPIPAAGRVRLAAVAEAAGFPWTAEHAPNAPTEGGTSAALDQLLTAPAPALLVVGVDREAAPYGGPGDHSGVEHRAEFQRQLSLARGEGRAG
jgi:thiamine pyrophosphate-dependent acetolactate synthase large subunit-like protein